MGGGIREIHVLPRDQVENSCVAHYPQLGEDPLELLVCDVLVLRAVEILEDGFEENSLIPDDDLDLSQVLL